MAQGDFIASNILREEPKYEEKGLLYRKFDAANRMELFYPRYLLLEDYVFVIRAWTPEERGLYFKENNFTNQLRFWTDIYYTSFNGPSEPHTSISFPKVDPRDITLNVHIPELSQMNGLYFNFRVHIRFEKQWTILDAKYIHNEGIVTFNCNQIESFFIASTPQSDKHIVTPDGYEFVSKADTRIKVNIPAGSVSQDDNFEFKVIPLNRESMATKALSNLSNCFILAISECLSVQHSVPSLGQPVDVQLPVEDLPGIDTTNIECKYGVFNRKHTGSFKLTNLEVEERDGVPTVIVNSFSEYIILKIRREMFGKIQSLIPEIDDAVSDKIWCKILYFINNRKPNSTSVMLECVPKDRIEKVALLRRSMGYELVRKCLSPDFFLPINQRIRVQVTGNFALSKQFKKSYYFISLFPPVADNFIYFPVDRNAVMGSDVHGIISFMKDNGRNKDLHIIHHDPWSSSGIPLRHPRILSGWREMESAADNRSDRSDTNVDETFFSDKGLLAVAQLISPEAMYKVVINLNMTHAHYEQIMSNNNSSALPPVSRHVQLFKVALEIDRHGPKIERLLSALKDSDENTIAKKIEALHYNQMSLSRSNLEQM